METDIAYVEECTNLEPVVRGHDKESIEEIRYNAPAHNRTRDRAVTLMDYEDLLCINVNKFDSFFGILNTKAIRNEDNALNLSLYYQMREDYEMTQELEDEIADFFSTRTMLGTSYTLKPYESYTLNISANLIVSNDYLASEVQEEVESYLTSYFSYGNFTFGDEIVKSELEEEVKNSIDGIRAFRIVTPSAEVITTTNDYEIFTLGTITLNVSGGEQ